MSQRVKDAFYPAEVGSLRAVYLLSISALGHTHYIDEAVMAHLADSVFEAYIESHCPPLPMLPTRVEDMAVRSIELLVRSHYDLLVSKH